VTGRVLILGTGGTIAGVADAPAQGTGYRAAALSVDQLVGAVPALADYGLETRQVAQVDSKDMSFAIWADLHRAVVEGLKDGRIDGIVITHGTDTLEETAYFLARTLLAAKPVVLTAAMRPATASSADGPQNLLDAVRVATDAGAAGVRVCVHGQVFPGHAVRKRHPYALNAFASSREPTATVEEGCLRPPRPACPSRCTSSRTCRGPGSRSWPATPGRMAAVSTRWSLPACRGWSVAATGNGHPC
jgi:L-asparaginase